MPYYNASLNVDSMVGCFFLSHFCARTIDAAEINPVPGFKLGTQITKSEDDFPASVPNSMIKLEISHSPNGKCIPILSSS